MGDSGPAQRLFLAVPPPARLLQRLAEVIEELRADAWDLRPVEPDDLHLTLHFLGDTPARVVDDLKREIGALCHSRRSFDLGIGGIGCFPDDRTPHVVWAGVRDYSGRLQDLFQAARRVLNSYRLFDLRRDYAPHLTLARVEKLGVAWDPRLLRGLEPQWHDLGIYGVEEVRLMRSRAGEKDGPRYESLASLALGGRP